MKPSHSRFRLAEQTFELGHRVLSTSDDGQVPVSSQGTVIGIENDNYIQVLFDIPNISFSTLSNLCSENRGLCVSKNTCLNLTNVQTPANPSARKPKLPKALPKRNQRVPENVERNQWERKPQFGAQKNEIDHDIDGPVVDYHSKTITRNGRRENETNSRSGMKGASNRENENNRRAFLKNDNAPNRKIITVAGKRENGTSGKSAIRLTGVRGDENNSHKITTTVKLGNQTNVEADIDFTASNMLKDMLKISVVNQINISESSADAGKEMDEGVRDIDAEASRNLVSMLHGNGGEKDLEQSSRKVGYRGVSKKGRGRGSMGQDGGSR